jgi:hypothetical protein
MRDDPPTTAVTTPPATPVPTSITAVAPSTVER